SRSTQMRPSGFSITSMIAGSSRNRAMDGPSAVRNMRAPRWMASGLWWLAVMSAPVSGRGRDRRSPDRGRLKEPDFCLPQQVFTRVRRDTVIDGKKDRFGPELLSGSNCIDMRTGNDDGIAPNEHQPENIHNGGVLFGRLDTRCGIVRVDWHTAYRCRRFLLDADRSAVQYQAPTRGARAADRRTAKSV